MKKCRAVVIAAAAVCASAVPAWAQIERLSCKWDNPKRGTDEVIIDLDKGTVTTPGETYANGRINEVRRDGLTVRCEYSVEMTSVSIEYGARCAVLPKSLAPLGHNSINRLTGVLTETSLGSDGERIDKATCSKSETKRLF